MRPSFVHRPIVMTRRGLVVAGHHAAAEAGAEVLAEGGNAMDAVVTAAATLAAAVPFMNGLGGDCFALWFDRRRGEAAAVNGSGAAPAAATPATYRARGLAAVPQRGPLSISVPGAAHAWAEALGRFGRVSLERALAPAVRLAEEGLPLDRVLRDFLGGPVYADLAARFSLLSEQFGPAGGRRLGEWLRLPALAESLRTIGRAGVSALYGGPLGDALAADAAAQGALLTRQDLAAHTTLVQTPLRAEYRDHAVLVSPPNTQGIAAGLLLALLGQAERAGAPSDGLGRFLRLKRAAFGVRDRYLGDPATTGDLQPHLEGPAVARLLAAEEGREAGAARGPAGGDTTTVVAVDADGNAASLVQSLFDEFGSGVVSRRTGIVLQNRLHLASLEPGGPNTLAPGRRPFHTLCPALLVRDGACRLAIATPGDHGQPQTIAQVVVNLLAQGMDVQEAIEAPRIRHDAGDEVMHESRVDEGSLAPLRDLGYRPRDVGPWSRLMGGVNAVYCPDGVLRMGGADPRRASYAIAE